MKHLKIFTLLTATLIATGTFAFSIRGNEKVVKVDRKVEPFKSISTSNGWDIILTQGNTYSMTIEADENLIDLLETIVKDGKLEIRSKKQISQSKVRRVHLTFKELEAVSASGGSDVKFETPLKTPSFSIALSGGSDLVRLELQTEKLNAAMSGGSDAKIEIGKIQSINIGSSGGSDVILTGINAEKASIALSGGSDAKISGTINNLTLSASGGSDVSGQSLTVKDLKIELSGASDGKIEVTGTLDISLSGGSDFYCIGKPEIKYKNICRSCDFIMK
jgi:hypothetical protein